MAEQTQTAGDAATLTRPSLWWRRLRVTGFILIALGIVGAWWQPPHPDHLRPTAPWDALNAEWWLYPVEVNAHRRPAKLGSMRALHITSGVDGPRLWTVGDSGLLHSMSENGHGEPEKPTLPPEAADKTLRDIHFADNDYGWAVGNDGVIIATQDGGRTWRSQVSGTKYVGSK